MYRDKPQPVLDNMQLKAPNDIYSVEAKSKTGFERTSRASRS